MKNGSIGVFDSGIGGLTVVKKIFQELPQESIIYVGDTMHIPYGTKSKREITQYSTRITRFLLTKNIKVLVVACNTISAVSLKSIKSLSPVPVIEVIQPTVVHAVKTTKKDTIGVIGTNVTVESGRYEALIKKINSNTCVIVKSCTTLVELAEKGILDGKQITSHIKKCFSFFNSTPIDVLILGCTHYPLFYKHIKNTLRNDVSVIDPSKPTVEQLKKFLLTNSLLSTSKKARYEFYVTGDPQKATYIASTYLKTKFYGKFEKVLL